MTPVLLTHGYFLAEDEKERQIMKPYPPLGLLYLSAWLKVHGIECEVYDSTFGERDTLVRRLGAGTPGLIGIYTNLTTRPSVLAIVRAARERGWTVVLGGPESANYPDEYLAAGAHVVAIGEGEATLLELVSAFRGSAAPDLRAIAGIAFRDDSGIAVRTPPRTRLPDLDALPLPDRESIDHGPYLDAWRTHHGASSINLITARGCPYRCAWCAHSVYGYSHRRRSPAKVAEEVQWIVDRYAPDQLWYADDVFTISHPWLRAYLAELQKRGLHRPFETITRADRLQTDEAARTLKALGCYRVWIGSESGSQRILDAMDRGVSVAQVREAVRIARRHGIAVGMFLMWGYEGEEIEDIAATVDHVKATDPDVFFTTLAYPIRGTPYFDRVKERVSLPVDWATASDRDHVIAGRRGREWYRLADQWLRQDAEAARIAGSDPARAAHLRAAALEARATMLRAVASSSGDVATLAHGSPGAT